MDVKSRTLHLLDAEHFGCRWMRSGLAAKADRVVDLTDAALALAA